MTGTAHESDQPRVPPGLILGIAVLGMSVAGPLVRMSAQHPVVIAFWRLAFSLVLVSGGLLATAEWRQWRSVTRRELALALAAGIALAAHFWSWNASIHLTTIAASVTLVSTQPAIVAALSALYLHERPASRQLLGIALAIAGAAVIAIPDLLGEPEGALAARNPPLGNLLALVGAFTAAAYFVVGRRLRGRLGVWSYVGIVYPTCLVVLVLAAGTLGLSLWPQPNREMAIFAGLAIGPMLLAHTGMNWALRYRPAYVVNVTVLAEPVGASLLAAFLPWLAEVPPGTTLVGGAIVLAGIALAAWRRA